MNDSALKLAKFGGEQTVPKDYVHPTWPSITEDYERAIIKQMHASMSIYNRSGIFEEFENKFAKLHGAKYALLCNSGTNAIWSMLVGAGLSPGDEVLCPTYTFFATNTPLLWNGLVPVFCDAAPNGTISVEDIEDKLTDKTRAIIITHMWGYPCDMDALTLFAKKHNLLLFEDCSHAHLATYKGKPVGSFGDAAAWSLQGQKNITGGEGGILLTNNEQLYYRANLHGHYNKRCKQEIPDSDPLSTFALTGMGLKLRAHPLAIAFANVQLDKHQDYQAVRNYCAAQYDKLFSEYDFIESNPHPDSNPSWYGYVTLFNAKQAKISREDFVDLLHAEGLEEVDIPGSTVPNHNLPLFKNPHYLFPHFYNKATSFDNGEFPGAESFYSSVITFPTWTQENNKELLDYYIMGLRKVLEYVRSI